MFRRDDLRLKASEAVTLELSTDQLNVFVRIQEAERRTVNCDESAAMLDILQQSLFGLGRDALDICEDQ